MDSIEVFDTLEKIAATNSRVEKEEILGAVIDDPLMLRVLKAACDPMITYGVKPKKPDAAETGAYFDMTTERFWKLLDDLRTRQLTGNAARDALAVWFYDLDAKSAELLHRILTKDLRCGFTANTVNRVAPGTIPVFKVMLSHPYEAHRVRFPVAVEPKLDGFRTACLIVNGNARFFSRTGNVFPALDHLAPAMVRLVEKAHAHASSKPDHHTMRCYRQFLGGDAPRLVIDGEALTGSFNQTSGDLRRQSAAASNVMLNVFDAVPYDFMVDDAQAQWAEPFQIRRRFVEWLMKFAEASDPIRATPMFLAIDQEEVMTAYGDFRAANYEGAMVKDLAAPYRKRKCFDWMKIKPVETEDLPIVGAYEGEKGIAGMLGGFIVDRGATQPRVGGGFTHQERTDLWAQWQRDPASLIGRVIEVEFHEATEDANLRHSRFVRFRPDKDEGLPLVA